MIKKTITIFFCFFCFSSSSVFSAYLYDSPYLPSGFPEDNPCSDQVTEDFPCVRVFGRYSLSWGSSLKCHTSRPSSGFPSNTPSIYVSSTSTKALKIMKGDSLSKNCGYGAYYDFSASDWVTNLAQTSTGGTCNFENLTTASHSEIFYSVNTCDYLYYGSSSTYTPDATFDFDTSYGNLGVVTVGDVLIPAFESPPPELPELPSRVATLDIINGWLDNMVVWYSSHYDDWISCLAPSEIDYVYIQPTSKIGGLHYISRPYNCYELRLLGSGDWSSVPDASLSYLLDEFTIQDVLFSSVPVVFHSGLVSYDFESRYGDLGEYSCCHINCPVGGFEDCTLEGYPNLEDFSPSLPPSQKSFDHFIEFPLIPLLGYLRLESAEPCTLDISEDPSASYQPFDCSSDFTVFQVIGDEKLFYSNDTQNLPTPDAPDDYCSGILKSSYSLLSTGGDPLCRSYLNPLVESLAPAFTGLINFDPDDYDWGTFDFLKEPAKILFDAFDTFIVWLWDLYRGLLAILLPNKNSITWTVFSTRSNISSKIGKIDISSLNEFSDLSPSDMEDIKITLRGQEMTILTFELIEPYMTTIRIMTVLILGFMLLSFHYRNIGKFFSTSRT